MVPMCFSRTDAPIDMQSVDWYAPIDMQWTYLAWHVTSRDLGLRLISEIDLLRSKCNISTHLDVRNTMPPKNALVFLVQSLFAKPFLQKIAVLTFIDLCSLTRWSQVNSDNMLAKEHQKGFRVLFCGLLPIMVYEIIAHFRKNNMTLRQNWTLVTSSDLNIDLSEKMTETRPMETAPEI